MTEERKFELAWTQRTDSREPEPYIAFEVPDDADTTKTAYAVTFRVCPALLKHDLEADEWFLGQQW